MQARHWYVRLVSLFVAAMCILLVPALASADDPPTLLTPGVSLSRLSMTDQRDNPHTIDESVHLILFSADMGANDLVKEALEAQGKEQLLAAQAVYVAEISRMPRVITSLFAMPAMRRREYDMLLDRDGTLTRAWPRQEKEVTLIELDRLRITKIDFVTTPAALRERLAARGDASPKP